LKGVVPVAKTEFWEGKYRVVHDSSLRIYTIYLGEEEIGDRWTYEEAIRAIHAHANEQGKKEEKVTQMAREETAGKKPTYYMDWDEIDAGSEESKMVYYVMKESITGKREDDRAVFNAYDYATAYKTFLRLSNACPEYAISVITVKRDGKDEQVYQVKGKSMTAEMEHTPAGFIRAKNLCDSLNRLDDEEKGTGKFSLAVNDLDNLASETESYEMGQYLGNHANAAKTYKSYQSWESAYAAKKPKPVKESSLRSLRSFCEYVGGEKDYAVLFAYCSLREDDLTEHLLKQCGFTDISKHSLISTAIMAEGDLLFKKGKDSKRKDGKRVLAVAHRDTVIKSDKQQGFVTVRQGEKNPEDRLNDLLVSSCFDDRIGVFTILHMLPKLGCDVDILFTTDEEIGASTAEHFSMDLAKELTGYKGEGSPYSHIVEFDRRGEDVVAYQYEDESASWKEMEKEMETIGMVIGQGSFTDICYLSHLEAKAINVGMGTRDEHSRKSYLEIRPYLSNLLRYAKLYHKIQREELVFPHEDKGSSRSSATYASTWSEKDEKQWNDRTKEINAKRRAERNEAYLQEANNPKSNQLILMELPNKHFSSPVSNITSGLTYERSLSIYKDNKTGDLYLYDGRDFRLYIVEDGDIFDDKGGK
jgi:hypothetical protein